MFFSYEGQETVANPGGFLGSLSERIRDCHTVSFDLTDYTLDDSLLKSVVSVLNTQPVIKCLTLRHNQLDDQSVKALFKLQHIESLDVRYNNLSSKTISELRAHFVNKNPSFALYADVSHSHKISKV